MQFFLTPLVEDEKGKEKVIMCGKKELVGVVNEDKKSGVAESSKFEKAMVTGKED